MREGFSRAFRALRSSGNLISCRSAKKIEFVNNKQFDGRKLRTDS